MSFLKKLRDYFFYCGIDGKEYKAIKKEAYVSNFVIWRSLHFLIAATFIALYVIALLSNVVRQNAIIYLVGAGYSVLVIILFFILKKDSLIAQFIIYISISLLFLLGGLVSLNNPKVPATTFIVFLLIAPLFMIDKPFFMAIELSVAAIIFLVFMHGIKPQNIWYIDLVNVGTFTVVGIFLNVIANAIRIREFVLTRTINIQKDMDEMTGLKNKGALTREINQFLEDETKTKGIMFMLDIDRFKMINDTYGHDIGDSVISQLGAFLGTFFINNEIVGRFGGDEFIIFIKDTDDLEVARKKAEEIAMGAAANVLLPVEEETISVSIGVAIYHGLERNYSELFKKADIALYKSKANPDKRFAVYE